MRLFLTGALLAAAPAFADYTENRDLVADAKGISAVDIDAGAGSLEITGSSSVDSILVEAEIVVDGANDKKGASVVEKRVELTLERKGDRAILVARFDSGMWGSGNQGRINLVVQVPDRVNLEVDDSSGSMRIRDVLGDVRIDDGSGSIDVANLGSLYVDDGSGNVSVRDIAGDVEIDDGSGTVVINTVGGSVYIDDGSGSINVNQVSADLIIISDGSGSVNYSNVAGKVELDDD